MLDKQDTLWKEVKKREYPKLTGDIKTDITIVGAGMAGLLCAYMLRQSNYNIVIIDKYTIGSGVSRKSNAKITSAQGIIYSKILKYYGNKARDYYDEAELAIQMFDKIIGDNNIQCNYEKASHIIYSTTDEGASQIQQELVALEKLKITYNYKKEIELPIKITSAYEIENQRNFNPVKFMNGIVDILERCDNITFFENTRAIKINSGCVYTENASIKSEKIIIATNFPITNKGFYFAKMHQEKAYIISGKLDKKIKNMYLGVENDAMSVRGYTDDDGEHILMCGLDHRVGNSNNDAYQRMYKNLTQMYEVSDIIKWSAQDSITLDEIPYIGKACLLMKDVYVCTGFRKWGMANSMVSAMRLKRQLERNCINDSIYTPSRVNTKAMRRNFWYNAKNNTNRLLESGIYRDIRSIKELKEGNSIRIKYKGNNMNVAKVNGTLYFVADRCTHMKCLLNFNKDELTYDCPCHGSRFDYYGNCISTPAVKNLKQYGGIEYE